ncbi:YebC/PmpR family DNA-binding transcriptional regulator [Candidatus Saccharibacteria bacterium]|nr:YebC/PmpR family DNA-binding transcriptional regulator [Candidatus Saccharibacteria bacterium]MCL1962983.1 YebC/PmpR family DNA-binding transcriptional regulator [Candidatus Saccharibacteria bacterium]
MSGHSKWATTKRQKAVVDAKRGAVFTKIGNMIAIAARGGVDPAMNPNLAMAIDKAKTANMPAANIQRAIDRVADKNAAALEEIVYEAYGPGGVGLIIETATDNRNRTFPEVRSTLVKHGGSIAEPGSVAFQFTRKGVIRVALKIAGDGKKVADKTWDADEVLLAALDAGAADANEDDGEIVVYTDMKDLHKVRESLSAAGYKIEDAGLEHVPNAEVEIADAAIAQKVMNLLDAIDDLDDVVNVSTNANITAEV